MKKESFLITLKAVGRELGQPYIDVDELAAYMDNGYFGQLVLGLTEKYEAFSQGFIGQKYINVVQFCFQNYYVHEAVRWVLDNGNETDCKEYYDTVYTDCSNSPNWLQARFFKAYRIGNFGDADFDEYCDRSSDLQRWISLDEYFDLKEDDA